MTLRGSTALVTGANRGIGRHFAAQLLERGATVYAAARRPQTVQIPGVTVLQLDITDSASVRDVAERATDVDVLINNAADTAGGNLVTGDLAAIESAMDTSYFGTLAMIRSFATILAQNGGGAILNVLSVAAWTTVAGNAGYCAAKAAQWALTNAVRVELAQQGTQVTALVPGLVATESFLDYVGRAAIDLPGDRVMDPAELVRMGLDGLEAGETEVLDQFSAAAKAALSGPPQVFAW